MGGRHRRSRGANAPVPRLRTLRLAGLSLVVAIGVTAWSPLGDPVIPAVRAEEPPAGSPDPLAEPEPTSAPTPDPTPTPTADPTPDPTPTPTADPTPTPTPTPSPTPTPTPQLPPPLPTHCIGWSNGTVRARQLLAGNYQLSVHPVVTLGLDPTWKEDPLKDRNWQFQHHTLWSVLSLLEAFAETGEPAFRDRADFLMRDWVRDNPRTATTSVWAWNDHSTALRAAVLACAVPYFPQATWLPPVMSLHGTTLVGEAFYVDHGNHALNQSIGLLEVAHVLHRDDWKKLAVGRIATLILESVDSQGVTNEQSIGYQRYNLTRYRLAESRLQAMELPVPAAFSRLDQMPKFLAYATRPDGKYETIGDTDTMVADPIPNTWAAFAATKGETGPKPPASVAVYRAGFLFARTGWGETRPFADEVFLSHRFGPSPYIHGHADGTAITLYGYGAPLLLDPGKYSYNFDAYRTFVKGRSAHNVVTVDGPAWNTSAVTTLVTHRSTATMVEAITRTKGYAGVSQQRRVTFSRRLGYVLVEDRGTATVRRTFRQLWHLSEAANPLLGPTSFSTRRNRGNVLVRQLLGGQVMRIVRGRTSPVQGWISYRHGERIAAPVVEVIKTGTSVRYLTLVVPAAGRPLATVRNLRITRSGYSLVVTVGNKSERVTVTASGASIVPLN